MDMTLLTTDAMFQILSERSLEDLPRLHRLKTGYLNIIERKGGKVEVMRPGDLGEVMLETDPVISQKWGKMYLIRLRRPIRIQGTPRVTPHASGRQDGW